ncbi:hypothetical protein VP01_3215g1 [Puccinia sorghi]|uniref:Uncharacterized protein n=1 Tax=Puccinia sorghi TaxID=27349 RepID=A0A0L6V072_9BASI|nr:hypothetical protein VP01_3215g1 [Puccinia sorghi]
MVVMGLSDPVWNLSWATCEKHSFRHVTGFFSWISVFMVPIRFNTIKKVPENKGTSLKLVSFCRAPTLFFFSFWVRHYFILFYFIFFLFRKKKIHSNDSIMKWILLCYCLFYIQSINYIYINIYFCVYFLIQTFISLSNSYIGTFYISFLSTVTVKTKIQYTYNLTHGNTSVMALSMQVPKMVPWFFLVGNMGNWEGLISMLKWALWRSSTSSRISCCCLACCGWLQTLQPSLCLHNGLGFSSGFSGLLWQNYRPISPCKNKIIIKNIIYSATQLGNSFPFLAAMEITPLCLCSALSPLWLNPICQGYLSGSINPLAGSLQSIIPRFYFHLINPSVLRPSFTLTSIFELATAKKLAQLPAVDMQKVPGISCCYSDHSPRLIKQIFDAQSLGILHSDCAKTLTYENSLFCSVVLSSCLFKLLYFSHSFPFFLTISLLVTFLKLRINIFDNVEASSYTSSNLFSNLNQLSLTKL